jgi:hypothetical protein
MQAGAAAGCRRILIAPEGTRPEIEVEHVAPSLWDAAVYLN